MNDLYLLGEPFRMQLYWETMQKRFLKFLKYPQENRKDRKQERQNYIYIYFVCVCDYYHSRLF